MPLATSIARNVTGRPANRAGVWSTLKTVDRRKMTAEEEKIALVAVVAVKEEWKAPGEVNKKRRLAACFCSLWDQNALFLHTLRAFFEAFQGDGSFVYAMLVAKDNSNRGNTLKLKAKVEFLGFFKICVCGNGGFECFTRCTFTEKRAKAFTLRHAQVY